MQRDKKRLLAPLEKAKHAWVDELPSVLWSLRTTPNAASQETPFFLVHDAKAVLPVEITHEAPRIAAYDETTSTEALQDNVDAIDEARDVALARAMQYQQNLRNYHSSQVRPRSFVVGDLVLRLKQDGHGKLESPWVGPYIVTEVIPGGEALHGGALGPGAAAEPLGLFLLPTGRPGHRFIGTDGEATTAGYLDLFLLPRERPRPRFVTCLPMFRCEPPASAMGGKRLERKP
jgi:hypothetical protein